MTTGQRQLRLNMWTSRRESALNVTVCGGTSGAVDYFTPFTNRDQICQVRPTQVTRDEFRLKGQRTWKKGFEALSGLVINDRIPCLVQFRRVRKSA